MLGVLNDMAFLYMEDLGVAGPDQGKGGKHLVLPSGYKGEILERYFTVQPHTYGAWLFMRGYLDKGIETATNNIKDNLKVCPPAKATNPPKMEFTDISGMVGVNTIPPNDFSFYEDLKPLIQEEPIEIPDPEARGLIASIGIVKGKPFDPDARMKKILTDAVAIGNATVHAISGLDSQHRPPDGSKTFKLHLPPNPPVEDFRAITPEGQWTSSTYSVGHTPPRIASPIYTASWSS